METKAELKLMLLVKTAENIMNNKTERILELEKKLTLEPFERFELGLCYGAKTTWQIVKHECLLSLEK